MKKNYKKWMLVAMSSILVGGIFMLALTGCKKEINLNDKIIIENVALVDQDVQAKKLKLN